MPPKYFRLGEAAHLLPMLCIVWVATVGAMDFSPLRIELAGDHEHCLGSAILGTGDLDGDGRPDFLVGAPGGCPDLGTKTGQGGTVRAVSGRTGEGLYSATGGGSVDYFGSCLAKISDINSDGVPDFLVGAPGTSIGGVVGSGRVFALSGVDGAQIYSIPGPTASSFGVSLVTFPDLDGDGSDDFAVGAPRYNNGPGRAPGAVLLYSGRTGSLIRTIVGRSLNESFGPSLADGGDPNSDGSHDLVVGAPVLSYAGPISGSVYFFDMSTGVCTDSLSSPGNWPDFGSTVALLGDVDSDGVPDLAVGAPTALNEGIVTIYSGQTHALVREHDGTFGSSFGAAITVVGDFDSDSVQEYLIGAPTTSSPLIDAGEACLYSGADGALLSEFTGNSRGAHVGSSCAELGDVNGDGRIDFAIGATGVSPFPGSSYLGSAVVLGLTDVKSGTAFASGGKTDLRLATGGRICLYLQALGSEFTVNDVVTGTLVVRLGSAGERAVVPVDVMSGTDINRDGVSEVGACFDVDALRKSIGWDGSSPDTATLLLEADLTDGSRARAVQLFNIVGLDAQDVFVTPNPIVGEGTLTFRTSRVGRVSVDLFDVRGRRVASLFSEEAVTPGVHDVGFGSHLGDGMRLASGVYFVRIESVEGVRYRKVVVLRM